MGRRSSGRPKPERDEIREFARWLRTHAFSDKTIKLYTGAIRRYGVWLSERGRSLLVATADDLADYARSLPATYWSRMQLRNAWLAYWKSLERPRQACALWAIPIPRRPDMEYRGIELGELLKLLAGADRLRNRYGHGPRLAVALMYYAGLRREECARLPADCVQRGRLVVLGKGTGGGATRRILVHPQLAAVLEPYIGGPGWLFPSKRGRSGHVGPSTINDWVTLSAAAGGVEHVTPHQLRFTCLGTMLDRTKDLRATAKFAGHSRNSLGITAGYTFTSQRRELEGISSLTLPLADDPTGRPDGDEHSDD